MHSSREYLPVSQELTRRQFGALTAGAFCGRLLAQEDDKLRVSVVSLMRGRDRRQAVQTGFALIDSPDFAGKDVYLKGNYNSPDPYPASTHPDTLSAVVEELRARKCGSLTLVERSGMGTARDIWETLGVTELARRLNVRLLPLEDMPDDQWQVVDLPGSKWKKGVEAPKFLDASATVVQITNIKTHRFGGVFSGSLKNSIGLIAKYGHDGSRYNYMLELHSSPDQRRMIAEVNLLYKPAVVVMDAAQVFVSGGPERGESAYPEAFAVSRDRVAIDAVGVALLRIHGAAAFRTTDVYEHEQLKRAAELKLGAGSAQQIEFLGSDPDGRNLAVQVRAVLSGIGEEKK
jgi:uncharacterized protein (DUF362 family)